MRTSTMYYEAAMEQARELVMDLAAAGISGRIEDINADCSAYPCPDGLESWSGETCAITVTTLDGVVFDCAYWCCKEC